MTTAAWPQDQDQDTEMEDCSSTGNAYEAINATLRQCHYLRQLRKFQAERKSYMEVERRFIGGAAVHRTMTQRI